MEEIYIKKTFLIFFILAIWILTTNLLPNNDNSNIYSLINHVLADETSFLNQEAGISAYTNVGQKIDLSKVKSAFRTIEKETENYIIGSVPLSGYPETEDVHAYVTKDGWILSYYFQKEPVAKIIDWTSYGINEQLITTKLEIGISVVCMAGGISQGELTYYDFRYPNADRMMIVVEAIWEDSGSDTFEIILPNDFKFYERSYSNYASAGGSLGTVGASGVKIDDIQISYLSNKGTDYGFLLPSQLSQGISHTVMLTKYSNSYWSDVYVGIVMLYNELGSVNGDATSSRIITEYVGSIHELSLNPPPFIEETALISQPNRPPENPTVSGLMSGTRDTGYTYSAVSTDPDNDKIQYIFNWDDGEIDTSEFLANGTAKTQTHTWKSAGKYEITVIAYDNETYSGTTSYVVLIDAHIVDDVGYIRDDDADSIYDTFHDTNLETVLGRDGDKYLIDSDGDGEWDYAYNSETEETTAIIGQPSIPAAPKIGGFNSSHWRITINWSPQDDSGSPITGYIIYRGHNTEDLKYHASVGNQTTYTDYLETDGTYFYGVSAVNNIGEGPITDIMSISANTPILSLYNPLFPIYVLIICVVLIFLVFITILLNKRRKSDKITVESRKVTKSNIPKSSKSIEGIRDDIRLSIIKKKIQRWRKEGYKVDRIEKMIEEVEE